MYANMSVFMSPVPLRILSFGGATPQLGLHCYTAFEEAFVTSALWLNRFLTEIHSGHTHEPHTVV